MKNRVCPVKRLVSAYKNSVAAFRHLIAHEAAFKQEVVALIVSVPLAYLITPNLAQFMLLVSLVALVIIVEVLNTAIEAVCDAVSPDFDAHIKIAKDCGSLAVLLSIFIACSFWLVALVNWAVA